MLWIILPRHDIGFIPNLKLSFNLFVSLFRANYPPKNSGNDINKGNLYAAHLAWIPVFNARIWLQRQKSGDVTIKAKVIWPLQKQQPHQVDIESNMVSLVSCIYYNHIGDEEQIT